MLLGGVWNDSWMVSGLAVMVLLIAVLLGLCARSGTDEIDDDSN